MDYPLQIGAEYNTWDGDRVKITGFWPWGRGFQVSFRRVLPYDNGFRLRCSWSQFKRNIKPDAKESTK